MASGVKASGEKNLGPCKCVRAFLETEGSPRYALPIPFPLAKRFQFRDNIV